VRQSRTLFTQCGALKDAQRLDEMFGPAEPAAVGA
jgi:hypothetical protein